jgi:AdoMet-dependent rRNA methyltransferase SPB1
MPKQETIIVAVDILPIRSLGPNVITLIGDITTDACKADIRRNLQGAAVDVVLHDGAPNVGASYDKDAYEQNEIALHALKCATQHLRHKGHFVTKLYRSRDYASYVWIAKQLFESVQAVKPTASRSQSAEIFLICQNYLAPAKIDPRMLDPKHVFEHVDGDTTGGGNVTAKFNIFHKHWDAQKRHRDGYNMEEMDFTMRKIMPIREFIEGSKNTAVKQGPVEILSSCTGMRFTCHECSSDENTEEVSCHCQFFLNHPATTSEIKTCVSDLKVLNKSDFKGLLTWRIKLLEALKELEEQDEDESGSDEESENEGEVDSDAEEEQIQSEIAAMRQRRLREKKKLKKKERALSAKRRRRAALGMDLNAVDVPEHDQVFSLATITSKGELEAVGEVELDKVTREEAFGNDEEDGIAAGGEDDEIESQGEKDDVDEGTGYSYRLDRELDEAYDRYLKTTKDGLATSGTKMAKRSKKLRRQRAKEEAAEDEDMFADDVKELNYETKKYAEMLQGTRDSDDESEGAEDHDDEEDDGFDEEPLTPEEHAAKQKRKKAFTSSSSETPLVKKTTNPLIHKLEESKSVKTARWFSNPLFEKIGNAAALASMGSIGKGEERIADDFSSAEDEIEEDDNDDDSGADEEEAFENQRAENRGKESGRKQASMSTGKGLDAEEVLAQMPKTDKQIRHERRLKAMAREERRQSRKAKLTGEMERDFEIAPADDMDSEDDEKDSDLEGLSEAKRKKILEARALIKAGMGDTGNEDDNDAGFEVVAAADSSERHLPVMDSRKYDSENEDYDSDDYVQTLALGTMMLRKSKAKALVDASYNRFAWNDPVDLPDWFVDDENRHYRPQIPIPQALIDKIKAKQLAVAAKPIAKVAEARARKNKRAKLKLAAAKKKAEAVAQSNEMSEAMKLKAISKAMRSNEALKPGKTYVVARKGGSSKGGKGIKLVDKRMKSDKRGMDRAEKKRKKGKSGGSSAKRRRH